jgi:hypothetical protein
MDREENKQRTKNRFPKKGINRNSVNRQPGTTKNDVMNLPLLLTKNILAHEF